MRGFAQISPPHKKQKDSTSERMNARDRYKYAASDIPLRVPGSAPGCTPLHCASGMSGLRHGTLDENDLQNLFQNHCQGTNQMHATSNANDPPCEGASFCESQDIGLESNNDLSPSSLFN